jgi:hypothetical protein
VSREHANAGYALLAALLVVSLAAIFASACVAAVGASLGVSRADHAGVIVGRAARTTLARAALELRRAPGRLVWSSAGADSSGDVSWAAVCAPEAAVSGGLWPRAALDVRATTGEAARHLQVVLDLRAESFAQGFTVGHDVDLSAPVTVSGGGLYCGGSVRGREWLSLSGEASGTAPAADAVHGDVWQSAAVHALGGIWADGSEVHAGSSADPFVLADTDAHTGAGPVESLTQAPDPVVLTLLAEMAVPCAIRDGVVHLDELPLSPTAPQPADGACVVVVPASEQPVRLSGVRAPGACPLVVIVEGDAVLGAPETHTSLSGALVCCGRLRVSGTASVTGHLYAGTLSTEASLVVVTPPEWRAHPLPGLTRPVVVAVR